MLRAFRLYKCKDESDMVFSLLGLLQLAKPLSSSPSFGRLLQSVDYNALAREMYISLAQYHLTFIRRSLFCLADMLECVLSTYCFLPSNAEKWPSWLPDWRNSTVYRSHASADFVVEPYIEIPESGYFEVERFRTGSSAINENSKCLSIAVLRSEEIVCVEKMEDKLAWMGLSSGIGKFKTESGLVIFGHPSIHPGDFLAFIGRTAITLVPFVFRPRSNTRDLYGVSQAILVGDCTLKHCRNTRDPELAQRFSRLNLY